MQVLIDIFSLTVFLFYFRYQKTEFFFFIILFKYSEGTDASSYWYFWAGTLISIWIISKKDSTRSGYRRL